MYVRTNYNTGPYQITIIMRDCTCPKYLDEINMVDPPASKPHIHIVGIKPGGSKRNQFYLNGYDEETLTSVWDGDRLYVVSPRDIFKQLSLF
jgi:hypothetical protein